MLRRSFLRLPGLAPVALPVAAKSIAEMPALSRGAASLYIPINEFMAGERVLLSGTLRADAIRYDSALQIGGDALIDPSVTRRLISRLASALEPAPSPVGWERLTPRERDVLVSLARGLANTEIAAQLHVGEETVKTHVSRVLAKLGLRDRTQAVIYVYEHRLLDHSG